jgi:tRNA(fMet)-specific endonuclease VapC
VSYVLDTNVVSELMKGTAGVIGRLSSTARDDVTVPQPVLAEIAFGLARLPKSRRRADLEARFDLIRAELPRADWTDQVSDAYGAIKASLQRQGQRIEEFDAAIAAHALATGAVLVTANRAHMARVPGLRIEDWSIVAPDA